MAVVTPGFRRRRGFEVRLPPGQYRTDDFPVLSAGPTPSVDLATWELRVTGPAVALRWSWQQFLALPQEEPTVDIHCVTKWSKLGTAWQGVSLDALLADVQPAAEFAVVHSYGGYTTNMPLKDLLGGRAWIVHRYDGEPLARAHGGPARLLVPHLYLWKSAKWVHRIDLVGQDAPGFWESMGYHDYGDPWREQRYQGD